MPVIEQVPSEPVVHVSPLTAVPGWPALSVYSVKTAPWSGLAGLASSVLWIVTAAGWRGSVKVRPNDRAAVRVTCFGAAVL